MKIQFDKEKQVLVIRDNIKLHFMILKILMVINIVNAALRLYNAYLSGSKTDLFQLSLGILSLGLFLYIYKLSVQEIIPVNEIEYVREIKIFGRRRFSLKLNNGKIRNLYTHKKDIRDLEKIFEASGISKLKKKV
jgi:hypothetical protein